MEGSEGYVLNGEQMDDYWLGTRKLEIHFEIVSKCWLNCIHCSSESDIRRDGHCLSSLKIENFIASIGSDIELYVCLTGGEPLLSNQFLPMVRRLRQFSNIKRIGFFTSGCLGTEVGGINAIDERMSKELKEAGVGFCYVSLYSHLNHVHDQITTVAGSHKFSLESIRNLLKNGIEAKINLVPMKYNKNEIEKTVYSFNELGVPEVRFLRLVRHGRAEKHWKLIGLKREDQRAMIERAIKSAEEMGLRIRITVAGFPEIWNCRPFETGEKCQAGIGLYYIDSKGRVFPCACKKRNQLYFVCNIDANNIREKLFSPGKVYNVKCLQDG